MEARLAQTTAEARGRLVVVTRPDEQIFRVGTVVRQEPGG